MLVAGPLSFATASANPVPPATAWGAGFLELARGIAPADGLAGRSTSAGEFLSLLGMPLEGANPPAHTWATDSASNDSKSPFTRLDRTGTFGSIPNRTAA